MRVKTPVIVAAIAVTSIASSASAESSAAEDTATPSATTPSEQPDIHDDDDFSLNPVAIGFLGGGLAAVATGVVIDLWTIPRIDDRRDSARARGNSERVDELTRQRWNYDVGATGGYVIGSLFTVVSLAWIGYDYIHHPGDDAEHSWRVTGRFGPDGGGVVVNGRF